MYSLQRLVLEQYGVKQKVLEQREKLAKARMRYKHCGAESLRMQRQMRFEVEMLKIRAEYFGIAPDKITQAETSLVTEVPALRISSLRQCDSDSLRKQADNLQQLKRREAQIDSVSRATPYLQLRV